MKVFAICGFSKSGKTTTAEYIIGEFVMRGYSVGSVKDIHFEGFEIDTAGTNTHRHKIAGSQLVTARGLKETDILFQKQLSIDEILSFYDQDFVILEGPRDANIPKILTASSIDEIEERLDESVFAISGVISKELKEFKGIPIINGMTEVDKLVDLILERVPERLAMIEKEHSSEIHLKIGGRDLELVPFVGNILTNTIIALIKELKGYEPGEKVEVTINGSSK